MTTTQSLTQELLLEAQVTRRYLAAVPYDKLGYQPSDKSETLGRLAIHVAEIVAWWRDCLMYDELDFIDFEPREITTSIALLAYFDQLLIEAVQALAAATEGELDKPWSMRHGETVYFTLPKRQVLRIFCMNHLVHHRAQLGVYLRLLGVPVPATYGPSADDEDVILINSWEL
jgi:uncharacterized damage-inducible protein DinB